MSTKKSSRTPTLAMRHLGSVLLKERLNSGLDRRFVATELSRNQESLRRWERGDIAPSASTIRDIGRIYGLASEKVSQLCTLALESRSEGLFEGQNVPMNLRVLYESESTARLIESLELELIPGLLQTQDYLQHLQGCYDDIGQEERDLQAAIRIRRQEILAERNPFPTLRFVLGPAALIYLNSLPSNVRDAQLEALIEYNRKASVEIRVIEKLHAGMLGSFTIITADESVPGGKPFVYEELLQGGWYTEAKRMVDQYEAVFKAVFDEATPLKEHL